jgi:hypothetical protein
MVLLSSSRDGFFAGWYCWAADVAVATSQVPRMKQVKRMVVSPMFECLDNAGRAARLHCWGIQNFPTTKCGMIRKIQIERYSMWKRHVHTGSSRGWIFFRLSPDTIPLLYSIEIIGESSWTNGTAQSGRSFLTTLCVWPARNYAIFRAMEKTRRARSARPAKPSPCRLVPATV